MSSCEVVEEMRILCVDRVIERAAGLVQKMIEILWSPQLHRLAVQTSRRH